MLMLGCKVVKSRKLLPLYFVLFVVVLVVNVVFPYVTLSFFTEIGRASCRERV